MVTQSNNTSNWSPRRMDTDRLEAVVVRDDEGTTLCIGPLDAEAFKVREGSMLGQTRRVWGTERKQCKKGRAKRMFASY
jgi:hypothetical protein